MVRNILWSLVTVVALAVALIYPTSTNQGVPLGRSGGNATAPATKMKTPSPSSRRKAPVTPCTWTRCQSR